ncbi:MAG: protein kinase [Gemmatimonadetes bacterium]|nr:protein kinase [Gemmatimonadota bacterium]
MNCTNCDTPIPEGSNFCLSCGTNLTDAGGSTSQAEFRGNIGERLTQMLEGRYKIGKMLGRGGMGAVFLAEDLTLERPVAIKVLPPEVSHDEKLVHRFEREARTAAKLDHPNIIPIFAVESADELHYFVMKYVAGDSLESVLTKGQLSIEQCQEYLWEAARALGHAHERHVVHRDIKPGNIMLDHDGRVMLADFGISKALQSATQLTGTGQVIGTPYYMSPEQAKGTPVDGRSDQYSLAVVGFEMLTGRIPFTGEAVHTIIYKQIFEDPPLIQDLRPDTPAHLATALHRALAKDPEHRFSTMEEFAAALMPQRSLSSAPRVPTGTRTPQPASPDAPTMVTPTTSPIRITPTTTRAPRRRGGMTAAVFSALLVTGGTGYWAWQQGMLERFGLGPAESAVVAAAPAQPETPPAAVLDTTVIQTPRDTAAPDSQPAQPEVQTSEPEPEPEVTRPLPVRSRPRPQPVQPPAPQFGRLSVNAVPWGIVLIDGVEIGETPLTNHELGPGRYVISILQDGCHTSVDTVTVTVNRPTRLAKQLVCGN